MLHLSGNWREDHWTLWPLRQQLTILGVIVIIASIVFYVGVLSPQRVELKTLKKKEQKLKQEFSLVYSHVAHLPFYQEQLLELEHQFKQLIRQIPTKSEVPDLLDDISQAAQRNGLEFKLIKRGMEDGKEGLYSSLSYDIDVSGGYHQLGSFISDVANMPRLVTLHNFLIKSGGRQQAKKIMPLQLQIKAKAYYNEVML